MSDLLPKRASVERITRAFPHGFCLDSLVHAKRACDAACHIRPGKHGLLADDWMRDIDFFNARSLRP